MRRLAARGVVPAKRARPRAREAPRPQGPLLRPGRSPPQQQRQPHLGRSAPEVHLRPGRLPLLALLPARDHRL